MDSTPRSSFIPKQTVGAAPKQIRRKRVFSVFGVLGIVMLVISVIGAGGIYALTQYEEGKLADQKSALATEYAKFDESKIARVQAVSEQLEVAQYLLDNHTSPSKIFDALEKNTKESVQYKTFSYERRPSGGVTLNITGVTSEFEKVSLQWTQYLEDMVLADVTMTKIGIDEGDATEVGPGQQVSFALTADIDTKNIPYEPRTQTEEVVSEPEVSVDEGVVGTSTDQTIDTDEEDLSINNEEGN